MRESLPFLTCNPQLGEAILSDSSSLEDDGHGIRLADARTESQIFLASEEEADLPPGEEERQHLVESPDTEDFGAANTRRDGLSAKAGSILVRAQTYDAATTNI